MLCDGRKAHDPCHPACLRTEGRVRFSARKKGVQAIFPSRRWTHLVGRTRIKGREGGG